MPETDNESEMLFFLNMMKDMLRPLREQLSETDQQELQDIDNRIKEWNQNK